MFDPAFGARHHVGCEIHRQLPDTRRQLAMGMSEKSRRTARHPSGTKGLQPFRFDIQSEDQRPRAGRIVNIGMRLPPVDQDGDGIGQRMNAVANDELGIRALHLEKDMTMRVRMADERAVHIEQCDPAEIAMHDAQRRRHLSLQSGVGLQGNEPPLDFIKKDREDPAENRDVQQADIHGVNRRNLPLNHKADAVMGATISEERNQDGTAPAANFIPAMIEGKRARDPTGDGWQRGGDRKHLISTTRLLHEAPLNLGLRFLWECATPLTRETFGLVERVTLFRDRPTAACESKGPRGGDFAFRGQAAGIARHLRPMWAPLMRCRVAPCRRVTKTQLRATSYRLNFSQPSSDNGFLLLFHWTVGLTSAKSAVERFGREMMRPSIQT
jgi:hypothetical protein